MIRIFLGSGGRGFIMGGGGGGFGVGSINCRTVDFGVALFNWSSYAPTVQSGTCALRCTMSMFCVKEADWGMMALVAYLAPWPRGGCLLGSGTRPPPPLPALRAHLVAKGQQLLAIHTAAPKAPKIFFFHSPCPFCPLCTPTLSLNPTLTVMPTPTLSLLLILPTNLTLDPNPNQD